ncbi:MAG: 3'-5' exonuclease [Victivallaceae bacterium]|nr:3'-5' exonuclease [Victivallaceae bacterium]
MPGKWYELGPFTVFDLETTGMSPVCDRIVEIGAVRVETDGSRREFKTLVNPLRPIPRAATAIHHIDDEMVADAPSFSVVAPDFLDFAENSTLIGHNVRFDLGFLQESLDRDHLPLWRGKTLDTIKLLQRTHPGLVSYRLQYLRRVFQLDDVSELGAHRAGADVEWTVQLLAIALTSVLKTRA